MKIQTDDFNIWMGCFEKALQEQNIKPDACKQIIEELSQHKFSVCQNNDTLKQFGECIREMIGAEAKE